MSQMNQSEVESYFDQYEDIAVDVISDEAANTAHGIPLSNAKLAEKVCQIMRWDDFSLFDTFDYEEAYNGTDLNKMFAYGLVAFLRNKLFTAAYKSGVGFSAFNLTAAADSELWHAKLIEKWGRGGASASHVWVN